MTELKRQQVRMRIYVSEQDHAGQRPLYEAILQMLLKEKVAGATAIRGIAGFGADKHMHSAHLLTLSQDLPIIIECIDSRENIDRVLPAMEHLLKGGLITLEPVEAIPARNRTNE